ncbi:MAG: CapA family protein [Sporichthyaceae bacterium]|nr:CapA family protein [Sporichthyaceae bacterium]
MSRRLTAIGVAALLAAGALLGLDALLGDSPAGRAGSAGVGSSSPSATPGPATPSLPATPAEPSDITVLMSGDVLLRDTLWAQARRDARAAGRSGYDFRPMLAGVRDAVSGADLAICHLETPVGAAGGPYSDYPVFNVPPQIVPALDWAGYDACTTASNHTLDQGSSGIDRTLAALDRAGIAHAGSARTAGESDRTTVLTVRGVRIALLSYTYGLNGFTRPDGSPWIVDLIEQRAILAAAKQARRDGADLVLVALHWGTEYRNDPTPRQRDLAEVLLDSPDIDLVYGHHAHVVQPFDRIGGKWIAYGLGNHLAEQYTQPERTHEGVMARFTFSRRADGRWTVSEAGYLPTFMSLRAPFRLVDLGAALEDQELTESRRTGYQRSFDRIEDILRAWR